MTKGIIISMKVRQAMFLIVCCFLHSTTIAQMTIQVTSTPQLTPILDDIYVAGSFNDWNPADENFKLSSSGNVWSVVIPSQIEPSITFKFTRGTDWDTVEGNTMGGFLPDRTLSFQNGTTQQLQIAGWEDMAGVHTVTSDVRILDMNFNMPQLNRTRRIWIALPDGYDSSLESYPVFYMHDGQNLFNNATSFSGEWQIDETLEDDFTSCVDPIIVVGIDNGGAARIDELSPWINSEYNEGGEGSLYANFIVETLKPFIDQTFRTKPEREFTGTGGSSLGALISMYMISKHNDVFSKAAIISPAFWFNDEINNYVEIHPLSGDSRLYFICGSAESASMVGDMQQMYNIVSEDQVPVSNLTYQVVSAGQHNEYYWSQQFPAIYSTLFDCTTDVAEHSLKNNLIIMPNPVEDSLEIRSLSNEQIDEFEIYSSDGKQVQSYPSVKSSAYKLDCSDLAAGTYVIKVKLGLTQEIVSFIKK